MFIGKTHYKWPFSIAMLVYQRVLFLILSPKTIGLAHGLNQQWIGIVGMEPKSNILERDGHDQT